MLLEHSLNSENKIRLRQVKKQLCETLIHSKHVKLVSTFMFRYITE